MPQPDPRRSDPYPDPDVPAESYRVPISGNLLDFLDVVNPVYDRDASTKGTANPKSHLHHHNHHQQQPAAANSQRFSGNLKPTAKAPIIALPNKLQHSGYLGPSSRKAKGRRTFAHKGVRVSEPGSPKVSWFGRVWSGREGSRAEESEGCWARLAAFFSCFGRREQSPAAEVKREVAKERTIPARERKVASSAEPPALGGMKRFVSGRRAASWGGDVEVDLDAENDRHVAWSGPLVRR